jgi:hypothetical protein
MSVSFLLSSSTIISGYSSHIPPPSSFWGRDQDAAQTPSEKSRRRDALLARQKRGAAAANLAQSRQEPGKKFSIEGDKHPLLAVRLLTDKAKRFPTKADRERASINP